MSIDSPQQLDQLTLCAAGNESVDEDGRVSFSGKLQNNDGTLTGGGIWSYLNGNLTTIVSPDAVVDAYGSPTPFTYGVAGLGKRN